MNEENLNRVIDTAAEQMVNREPPSSLGETVMARVMDGSDQPRRWTLLVGPRLMRTASVTAAVAACGVLLMVMVMLKRAPEPATSAEKTTQPAMSAPPVRATAPALPRQVPVAEERRSSAERLRNVEPTVRPSAPLASVGIDSFSDETSIAFESIVPDALAVPLLEVNAASVDEIAIEPLVIEPLTASND